MALQGIEIINGIFSLILVTLFLIVGLRIAFRYVSLKDKLYLYVGIAWVLMAVPWYPSTTSFLVSLYNNGMGLQYMPSIFFGLGTVLLPVPIILWFRALFELLKIEKQNLILIISALVALIYEIVLWFYLITDPSIIGTIISPFDANYGMFMTIVQVLSLLIVIITGYKFGSISLKSERVEHQIRGKFLIIAFISFTIGALFDVISALALFLIVIGRIIIISSGYEFYLGFILPKFVRPKMKTEK